MQGSLFTQYALVSFRHMKVKLDRVMQIKCTNWSGIHIEKFQVLTEDYKHYFNWFAHARLSSPSVTVSFYLVFSLQGCLWLFLWQRLEKHQMDPYYHILRTEYIKRLQDYTNVTLSYCCNLVLLRLLCKLELACDVWARDVLSLHLRNYSYFLSGHFSGRLNGSSSHL